MRCHVFHRRRLWPTSKNVAFLLIYSFWWIFGFVFSPFHTLLFPSPGRVKLARHCRSGKLAAVKILDLHPTLSSRASALANAGDKAEKMILTAEREIAVMKVCWLLILSTLSTPGINMAFHCIHRSNFFFLSPYHSSSTIQTSCIFTTYGAQRRSCTLSWSTLKAASFSITFAPRDNDCSCLKPFRSSSRHVV